MRLLVFSVIFPIALVCLAATSAYLLLVSCAVKLPFSDRYFSYCQAGPDVQSADRLLALNTYQDDLRAQVFRMEAELAGRQCEAMAPTDALVSQPREIDREAFNRQDISALQGCWQLVTEFDVTQQDTGSVRTYNQWQLCMQNDGTGTEVLKATDGTTCEGILGGSFSAAGDFEIDKPGDLRCSDGSTIFKTLASCNLDGAGRAICDLHQPNTGGRDRVELRRIERKP